MNVQKFVSKTTFSWDISDFFFSRVLVLIFAKTEQESNVEQDQCVSTLEEYVSKDMPNCFQMQSAYTILCDNVAV